MQQYTKLEFAVGVFMVAGIAALAYLSMSLGGLNLFDGDRYVITARFSSVGGLKSGDPVKISGVTIGEVGNIRLVDYTAEAELSLESGIEIPADTIASIQSNGLLGDAYVSLSPGGDDKTLAAGDRIKRTESATSLTELISKYAFGSPVDEEAEPKRAPAVEPAPTVPSPAPNASDVSSVASGSTTGSPVASPAATASSQPSAKPSPFSDPLE